MVEIIEVLLMLLLLTVICIEMGVDNFKRTHQTRYGKQHIEKEIRDIICIENDVEKDAKMEFGVKNKDAWISITIDDFNIEKTGENYFDTLIEIREILESKNIKLLCKGCCKYVYPSAMIISMGRGQKAYQLEMGKQAKMESLVDIFDACSSEEYATIEEQKQFFNEWCNSLGK